MAAAANDARSTPNRSRFDVPFILAFTIGVCVVFYFYSHGEHSFLPELLLLVIMGVYAIVATGRYARREDKLGDNLYYLGFLFTLTSLLFALVAFGASGFVIGNLVQSFGIALVTTLIGMFLRLLAYQYYGEGDVTIESAMRQLGDQVRLIGMQLHSTADNLATLYGKLAAAMDTAQQAFTRNVDTMSQRLGQADTALAAVVKEMSGVAGRLAALELPKDLLTEKFTPLTRSLVNNAKRVEQASALIAGGIDRINGTLATLDGNSAHLSDTMLKLLSVRNELEPLVELIRRICKEVDELGGQLNRSSGALVGAAAKSADSLTQLAARSVDDAALVARHRQGMESELDRLRVSVGEVSDAFRPLAAMVREREETEAKVTASYRAEMERELAKIRELHDELQTNAVSLIKFITGNLSNDRTGT